MMNFETKKTIVMAFVVTMIVLTYAISGFSIVFAHADELEPPETSEPPQSEQEQDSSSRAVLLDELYNLLYPEIVNVGFSDESWSKYQEAFNTCLICYESNELYSDSELIQACKNLKSAISSLELPYIGPPIAEPYIDEPFLDYEYQTFLTLKSIEYQLKIIAGGMVLAVISLFIWFTILKPIKLFTRV